MSDGTAQDELFFEPLKEHRGAYFVEYQPPVPSVPLATLCLVFTEPVGSARAAALLEEETRRWIGRFPVPLMASALDEKEDLIAVHGNGAGGHLFAWFEPDAGEITLSSKAADLDAFLRANPAARNLREIYAYVPARTKEQVKADADKYAQERRRQNLLLKGLLALWLVIIPAGIALFEYFGPEWLGIIALTFSLWQAWRTWRKITGRSKPSRAEAERAEKDRKMRHYYYHCERNPLGFQKLMAENLREDLRQRTRHEAAELARAATSKPPVS